MIDACWSLWRTEQSNSHRPASPTRGRSWSILDLGPYVYQCNCGTTTWGRGAVRIHAQASTPTRAYLHDGRSSPVSQSSQSPYLPHPVKDPMEADLRMF
jgi:hypothetical protein